MAKYSYAVIRRAIACKIMECEESSEKCEFVDDLLDWAIYKTQNVYHFIKFTSKTKDGHKYYFDKRITYVDEKINNIFENLFLLNEEGCEKTISDKSCQNVNFIFHFLTTKNLECFELYTANECDIKKLNKINTSFNAESKYYFKLNIIDSKLCLRPNPKNYDLTEISNIKKSIKISDDDLKKIINNEEIYKEDYKRILNRSFEYFIEYGTKDELNKIISQEKCNEFSNLIEHLNTNQKILSKNKKETGPYQSIVKYKEVDKGSLKIYEFKECFKKYFNMTLIPSKFLNKFKENRKCAYCGVPEDKLGLLYTVRNGRGNRLEYDRIISRDNVSSNKIAYSLDNIVLACYWCNNAKTDTFSPKDFKPIARGINQVWNEKLKQTFPNKTIYFEENSDIWNHEEINNEDKEN